MEFSKTLMPYCKPTDTVRFLYSRTKSHRRPVTSAPLTALLQYDRYEFQPIPPNAVWTSDPRNPILLQLSICSSNGPATPACAIAGFIHLINGEGNQMVR